MTDQGAGAQQHDDEDEVPGRDDDRTAASTDRGADEAAGVDPDSPGASVLGLQDGDPVEANEPA